MKLLDYEHLVNSFSDLNSSVERCIRMRNELVKENENKLGNVKEWYSGASVVDGYESGVDMRWLPHSRWSNDYGGEFFIPARMLTDETFKESICAYIQDLVDVETVRLQKESTRPHVVNAAKIKKLEDEIKMLRTPK